jgi:hypothetical protein
VTPRSRAILRAVLAAGLTAGALAAAPARADMPLSPTEPDVDDKVDFMHILSRYGLHDMKDERASAYGQITLIGSYKAPFQARYTNLGGVYNSLLPGAEGSWTATATLFLGLKLWRGAEVYVVPEEISERPFSHLAGLGSVIQNGELQKTGTAAPSLYMSRVYLKQTVEFGGALVEKKSDLGQLGGTTSARRLVFTLGKLSVLDAFDRSSVAGDVRRQFLGMAFMAHAAYDFGADARGYAWGGVAELYYDDWAVRVARVTVPEQPNQLAIDYRFWDYYGDQLEIEHSHKILGQPGTIRLLGYHNHANMARFDDAISAFHADPGKSARGCAAAGLFNYYTVNGVAAADTPNNVPDLCWARKDNDKYGIGVNVEQHVTDDIALFFRGMYSDGQTEVYAYTATDRSLSFGGSSRGRLWHRPADTVGLGIGMGWISSQHAAYLNLGGIDGFIGDGRINQATESTYEIYYNINVMPSLWLTPDYQHVTNPAYNADRGPVDIFSARLHSEF